MKNFLRNRLRDIRGIVNYIKYFHKFGKVGKRCVMSRPIRLKNLRNVELGDRVYILPGLRMETLEYKDGVTYHPHIKIGNGVTIGQNGHIFSASSITIGDNVGIGGNVMINDCSHGYADLDLPIQDQPITTKPIEIGENTLIGNNVLILPGVKIGRNCCIGGNVVISKSVPDYSIVSAQRPRSVVMPI
ncbi:MAG: acyltransferase [Pseudobutyrivibrio sp.]|nr:acyltransferase [Pseudobutyrivibrio sp.]